MARTQIKDGADPRWSSDAIAARRAAIAQYDGIFAETFDRLCQQTSTALIDGTVYYTRIGLIRGDVVTNLRIDIGGAGTGTSIAKLGLCDKNFNLLRISADLSAAVNSSGEKITPMLTTPGLVASPYTCTDDDQFYAAWFAKTATTMPGANRAFSFAGRGVSVANLTGQTDIPATASPTIGGSGAAPIWIGAS